MIKTLSFLLVTGAVALVACSSTKTSSGGSCASYVAALQESAHKCRKTASTAQQEADAAARLNIVCANALNAPGNGITGSALDACSEQLRASCDFGGDACEALSSAVGTLPDGTACGSDGQCQGGDCRHGPSGAASSSCGTCAQRVPIGGTCGSGSAKCVRGSTCLSKAPASGTCVATTKVAEGAVCYDPTKPSSAPATCGAGLVCKFAGGGTTAAPVTCTKRGAAGEACTQGGDCLAELACIKGKCGPPLPDGAACDNTNDCATGACPKAAKKCVPYEYGAGGAACNSEEKRCARGRCSQTTATDGKCVDPIADGSPCTAGGDSASGAPRCDEYATCTNGTCQIFDPATCK